MPLGRCPPPFSPVKATHVTEKTDGSPADGERPERQLVDRLIALPGAIRVQALAPSIPPVSGEGDQSRDSSDCWDDWP